MQPVKVHLLIAAVCLGAAQAAEAAATPPKPRLRPASAAEASAPAPLAPVPRLRPAAPPAAEAPTAVAAAIPVPRLRPEPSETQAPDTPEVTVPVPRQRPGGEGQDQSSAPPEGQQRAAEEKVPRENGNWPAAIVAAGRAECTSLLSGLDISYEPIDPIGGEGGCGTPAPVRISAVAGVKLSPPATETCAMAAALFKWVKDDVQPAARKRLGTEVTEIRTATSYACRRRNNASSGKLSEHGRANALDMSGFTFAKQPAVAVGGRGNWGEGLLAAVGLSRNGSFLEDIRKAACVHFTTVLGPGSDPYHGDHFHVDVLARKGGYRICQ